MEEQQALAKKAALETIKTGLEMPRLWIHAKIDDPLLFAGIEGLALLDEALAYGKGVIMITPHLGFWEYFILQVASLYPVTVLCNNVDDIVPARLNEIVKAARMKTGATVVEAKPGVRSLCEQLLQRGEIVMIAPDQIPSDKKAYIFADFFGQPTATMTLIPRLAEATGARLLIGFAKRLECGRYRLIIKAAEMDSYLASGSLSDATLAMNHMVENLIAESPAQFLWTYKRFRRGPEGKRKIYTSI